MSEFESEVTLGVRVREDDLRQARGEIEQQLGSVSVGVENGQATRPDGGVPGAGAIGGGAVVDELGDQTSLLEELLSEVESGGGGLGGGGGGAGGGGGLLSFLGGRASAGGLGLGLGGLLSSVSGPAAFAAPLVPPALAISNDLGLTDVGIPGSDVPLSAVESLSNTRPFGVLGGPTFGDIGSGILSTLTPDGPVASEIDTSELGIGRAPTVSERVGGPPNTTLESEVTTDEFDDVEPRQFLTDEPPPVPLSDEQRARRRRLLQQARGPPEEATQGFAPRGARTTLQEERRAELQAQRGPPEEAMQGFDTGTGSGQQSVLASLPGAGAALSGLRRASRTQAAVESIQRASGQQLRLPEQSGGTSDVSVTVDAPIRLDASDSSDIAAQAGNRVRQTIRDELERVIRQSGGGQLSQQQRREFLAKL